MGGVHDSILSGMSDGGCVLIVLIVPIVPSVLIACIFYDINKECLYFATIIKFLHLKQPFPV